MLLSTTPGVDLCAVLTLALLLDWLIGDPKALYRRVPHPVVLFGRLVGRLEAELNRGEARRLRGLAAILLTAGLAASIGALLTRIFGALPFGWLIEVLAVATLIAQRDLYGHVAAVARALDRDGLYGGRLAVAHIVGRDPRSLDTAGVGRAAIESCAENFSDGVVAPVFWYLLLGLPGLLAYKAINTADSMIGHTAPRYRRFGWAAARIDDLVNLIPARIAGGLLALAAFPWAEAGNAWRAMWRDARKHRSPNAGWQEAAMAGALGLALNGPRRYGGVVKDDPWMGDGRSAVTSDDIRRALRLYAIACGLLLAAVVLCWLI